MFNEIDQKAISNSTVKTAILLANEKHGQSYTVKVKVRCERSRKLQNTDNRLMLYHCTKFYSEHNEDGNFSVNSSKKQLNIASTFLKKILLATHVSNISDLVIFSHTISANGMAPKI